MSKIKVLKKMKFRGRTLDKHSQMEKPPEKPKRPSIYYLVGKNKALTPNSGCSVNELNFMKVISKFADVYYNNYYFDTSMKNGGIPNKSIAPPNKEYDIYYIRGNNEILYDIIKSGKSGKKICFAQPFDEKLFSMVDNIATLTESWTDKLYTGEFHDDFFCPNGYTTDKAITFGQVVDDIFRDRSANKISRRLRESWGGDFVIGHFGRLVDSCYPDLFLNILPKLIESTDKKLTVIFGMSEFHVKQAKRLKLTIDHPNISLETFKYDLMPFVLSACDLTLYNYNDNIAHATGSMKNIESITCGTPVLCPDFDARLEEFGQEYPLYYDHNLITKYKNGSKEFREDAENIVLDKLVTYINSTKAYKNSVSRAVRASAKVYSIDESVIKLEKLFKSIVNDEGLVNK